MPRNRPAEEPALPPPSRLAWDIGSAGGPLGALLALRERRRAYLASPLRGDFLQELGTLASFAGEYREALEAFDEHEGPRQARRAAFAGCEARGAVAEVARLAAGRRAVFINEAHHVPRHRVFTEALLGPLRERGFTHFAAETLSPDPDLARRGYPTLSSGWYTREPAYGELVRAALRLGFTVVAYEQGTGSGGGGRWERQNRREREQASHLKARVFDAARGARLLVHAGYGHIQKRSGGWSPWTPMAKVFMETTGIDPLCVDQIDLTERSAPRFESPGYRWAVRRFAPRQPVILVGPAGPWRPPGMERVYDAYVLHPRSRPVAGRPDWLFAGGRRPVRVPSRLVSGRAGPRLVQAFHAGEGADAIPADQVVAWPGRAVPALALRPGGYRLRVLAPPEERLVVR